MGRKRKFTTSLSPTGQRGSHPAPLAEWVVPGTSRGRFAQYPLIGVLVLSGLLGIVLGYRQISSPDIGWHLAYAWWIIARGWVPYSDPLSYTVSDHPAMNMQWVFQLLLYWAHELAGSRTIVLGTTALTLVFASLLMLRSWRRNGATPLSSVPLLMLFSLAIPGNPARTCFLGFSVR